MRRQICIGLSVSINIFISKGEQKGEAYDVNSDFQGQILNMIKGLSTDVFSAVIPSN